MIGVDTNVLVRYLTQDEPGQGRRATRFMAGLVEQRERAYINPIVLCELVWVLRDSYDTAKSDLLLTLDEILVTVQFDVGEKDRIREAVEAYRVGHGDFADYLIGAINRHAGCDDTVTFDRRLRRASGFRELR